MLDKAGRDMRESQRVALVKNEVETALKNAEHSIKLTLVNPETSYAVASRLIRVNPHIIGVGVAFLPNYFKEKGRHGLFMPYTYDDQPSIIKKGKRTGAPHIQTRIPDLDYTKRDWYHTAMAGECKWTEPYLGEGGINVLMCTYSIPVKDKNNRTVGVLFADVTMADATVLMNHMDSGILQPPDTPDCRCHRKQRIRDSRPRSSWLFDYPLQLSSGQAGLEDRFEDQ